MHEISTQKLSGTKLEGLEDENGGILLSNIS